MMQTAAGKKSYSVNYLNAFIVLIWDVVEKSDTVARHL